MRKAKIIKLFKLFTYMWNQTKKTKNIPQKDTHVHTNIKLTN